MRCRACNAQLGMKDIAMDRLGELCAKCISGSGALFFSDDLEPIELEDNEDE